MVRTTTLTPLNNYVDLKGAKFWLNCSYVTDVMKGVFKREISRLKAIGYGM
jgi:hypothetical protein